MNNIVFFLISLLVIGCRKNRTLTNVFSTSKIVNSSKQEVIIDIQCSRMEIEKKYGKNSYQMGTLSIENSSQISFDRVDLISKVMLKPKDSLMIEYVKSEKPKFEILKMIKIYSSSKELILSNKKNV